MFSESGKASVRSNFTKVNLLVSEKGMFSDQACFRVDRIEDGSKLVRFIGAYGDKYAAYQGTENGFPVFRYIQYQVELRADAFAV